MALKSDPHKGDNIKKRILDLGGSRKKVKGDMEP